ncbi:hypothetical protein CMUST_11560 [Corynebacterium mustelae]|uniref:Uncharacterized protein n=1 Tax=Corynebacterium mustelae TaxID=571915 RepID=A0A0G3H495_9CORY|nr:hypothetical protein [Corynebacterium mustelae]AKK06623.1 hypothetical protein CMUST_11560 [Corynebacterium mustelae]
MTAPMLNPMSKKEAEDKLHELETTIQGGIEEFEERARFFDLSPLEQGVWERISELRWLLGRS